MPLLEAFNGRQPDHRHNEVAIRHWDDYWFGKTHLFGDTFPLYWSALTGTCYAYFEQATGERSWALRAERILQVQYLTILGLTPLARAKNCFGATKSHAIRPNPMSKRPYGEPRFNNGTRRMSGSRKHWH